MDYENNGTVAGQVVKVIRETVGKTTPTDKATVVIDVTKSGDKYPTLIPITGIGKAAGKFANVTEGALVRCSVWLRGHEYNGRYYGDVAVNTCDIIDASACAHKAAGDTAEDMALPVDHGTPDDSSVMPF